MLVRELIEALQQYDPGVIVQCESGDILGTKKTETDDVEIMVPERQMAYEW